MISTREQFLEHFPRATASMLKVNGFAPLPAPPAAVLPAPKAPKAPGRPKTAPGTPRPVKAKGKRSGRVPLTRNAGTLSEAAFWGMVRSGLRRTFRWWKPALAALKAARSPCRGPRGQRWAYLCADCGKLFLRRQVQIDHVYPAGALTSYEHVGDWLRRLTPENPDAFAVRCLPCHQAKTNVERAANKSLQPANKSTNVPPAP